MTVNRRYADSLQRRRENKAQELTALVPRSLTEAERGDDIRTGPAVEVVAWIQFGEHAVRVTGFVSQYTDRAALVRWQGVDGESREAWTWSSAIEPVEP